LGRESQAQLQPDLDPELLMSYFLGQFIFDAADDDTGVYSGLRGHSLARTMYGWNSGATANDKPFNGTGRLHTYSWGTEYQVSPVLPPPYPFPPPPGLPGPYPSSPTYMNPFYLDWTVGPIDDYYLVNYTFFRD